MFHLPGYKLLVSMRSPSVYKLNFISANHYGARSKIYNFNFLSDESIKLNFTFWIFENDCRFPENVTSSHFAPFLKSFSNPILILEVGMNQREKMRKLFWKTILLVLWTINPKMDALSSLKWTCVELQRTKQRLIGIVRWF